MKGLILGCVLLRADYVCGLGFALLVVVLLLGAMLYRRQKRRHHRLVRKEYIRYRRVYNYLQTIYTHSPMEFALYDQRGRMIFCVLDGKRQQHAANTKDTLFTTLIYDSCYLTEELKKEIRTGQKVNREVRIASGKNNSRVYQLVITPVDSQRYKQVAFVAVGINQAPLLQERKEKKRFESLFDFASDFSSIGIGYYDLKTGAGIATKSWYKNLNEPYTAQLNPEYRHVWKEDREKLLRFRKEILQSKNATSFRKDIRVHGRAGKLHWVREHIFVNDKNRDMLIELNYNMDEQKRKENKLRKAKELAERSNKETAAFLANINHEIRTPLNAIMGFSTILATSEPNEETPEQVAIILRNNQLLTILIDDIIELSKLESGGVVFKRKAVNMNDLFTEVMASGYSTLYQKELLVTCEVIGNDPVVYTDENYLRRLFMNLFSNAIKFTDEGSVTLGYQQEDGYYYFYVKDTGCGISEENQKTIFGRFKKLDSYKQGTGLGLALCKSITEHLGGEIGVISTVGKGSTFWFAIPEQSAI